MTKTGNFVRTAGAIFTLVALTHLWISLTGSSISINGEVLGIWVSWLAFIITGYMALQAFGINK